MFKTSNKTWEPKQVHHTVSTFIESFKNSFTTSLELERKPPTTNLTKNETIALENLMLRDDIVICNADKGNAVVILDVEDYIKEANKQLGDTSFYKELSHEPN